MNKLLLILIPLLVILILGTFFYNLYKFSKPSAEIKGHKFQLIVAKTEKDKQVGLSKFKSLPKDQAMVFVFEKADLYPFWMKDMKFPIDIIFISESLNPSGIKDNKIVTIYQNLPTDNLAIYPPTESSDKVLEINANLSKKYGFGVGDSVTFKNLK